VPIYERIAQVFVRIEAGQYNETGVKAHVSALLAGHCAKVGLSQKAQLNVNWSAQPR
jgi:hypothetical protein